MSQNWSVLKQSKNFNSEIYRRGLLALLISLTLNGLLSLYLVYRYINQPAADYYSTNGVTAPLKLRAMLNPNYSSEYLLPSDIPTDDTSRLIPQ